MDQQRYTPEEEEEIRRLYGVLTDVQYWEREDDLMTRAHREMSNVLFTKFMKGRPEFHEHYVAIINDVDKDKPVHFTGADYPRQDYGPISQTAEEYAKAQGIPVEQAVQLFKAQANFQEAHNIGKRK